MPARVLDTLGLTVVGRTLSLWTEEAVLRAFGLAMLALAVHGFRQRD